uniref:Uncharacterized protein n=1 Tax=Trypanosoma vivax (strain Y486) TaxID=1055687 RepID=G0TV78_TRYVY|nr:hypothetical protein, unlikely [Trypanosoma vivax Y486]
MQTTNDKNMNSDYPHTNQPSPGSLSRAFKCFTQRKSKDAPAFHITKDLKEHTKGARRPLKQTHAPWTQQRNSGEKGKGAQQRTVPLCGLLLRAEGRCHSPKRLAVDSISFRGMGPHLRRANRHAKGAKQAKAFPQYTMET